MTIEERKEKEKMLLSLFREKAYIPMTWKELTVLLQVPGERRQDFLDLLSNMERDGKIFKSRSGKYALAKRTEAEGVYMAARQGFGFVSVEGREKDVFISEEDVQNAMDGDKVRIRIFRESQDGKKAEGKVIKVLERAVSRAVGTFQKKKHFGFVVPDNGKLPDIFIPEEAVKGAENKDKVLVQITDYGDGRKSPEGRIEEILGKSGNPDTEIEAIVKAFDIPEAFPEEVEKQLISIPERTEDGDMEGRLDLRGLLTVTIDGEDAKDLDDGVSLEKTDEGYRLGVHIADVSHYVKENSPLDRIFMRKSNSYAAPQTFQWNLFPE